MEGIMRTWIILISTTIILIFSSCKGPEGPMGPAGPAGQGLGSLSDPSIMPKVIYTYPPQNSVGPYEFFYISLGWIYERSSSIYYYFPVYMSQFQVRFNKYMDISSIRRSIAMSSPLGDVRIDTNYILSIGGDVFFINPVDTNGTRMSRWRIGQNYTFTVSSNARDINGNALQPSFGMSFMPEPYFRVRDIYPVNGATKIATSNSNIVFSFNSAVDTSIRSLIQISPPVFGQWYLSYDSMSLSLGYPSLENATTYTMTIGTNAHDTYGNHLLQPFVSSFTTLPFGVSYTYPANGSTGTGLTDQIDVEFTSGLDSSTIRSAFKIHPSIAGQFYLNYSSSSFQFSPLNEYVFDTVYTVTIDSSIRGSDGSKLAAPYNFSFRTAPFRVSYTYPYDGSSNNATSSNIQVTCDALIDSASVSSSFVLFDSSNVAVAGIFTIYSNSFSFTPTVLLKPNAFYRATVSTGLRSKQGKTLASPYSFSFMTGN